MADRLYGVAGAELETLRSIFDGIPESLNDYERALASATSSRRSSEDILRAAPARLARAEANRDRLQKEVTIEESRFRQLDQAATRVIAREAKTAESLLYWLGPFLSPSDRAALARAIDSRSRPTVERYQKIEWPAPAALPPAAAAPAKPVPNFAPVPPPPGSLETKLTALENVSSQIATLRPRVDAGVGRVNAAREAYEAESRAATSVRARASAAQSQYEKVEKAASALQDRLSDAIHNQMYAGKNLGTYAAYTYLWSDLKERVVVPAVRDYIASSSIARRMPLTDEAMKDLFDKVRDGSPSELLGLPQTARNIEKLIQTERIVLDTFKDTRSYIDRAIPLLVYGTPAEIRDLSNEVFTLLDERSEEIAEEATERLPGPVKAVAQKVLGR
jgi:predicted  nucleic acid-binding Zn-ribbon protein